MVFSPYSCLFASQTTLIFQSFLYFCLVLAQPLVNLSCPQRPLYHAFQHRRGCKLIHRLIFTVGSGLGTSVDCP